LSAGVNHVLEDALQIILRKRGFAVIESQELRAKVAEWRSRAESIDDRRLQSELVRLASLFEEAAKRIDTHNEAALSRVYASIGEA
jgi:predicted RNase H-like nuclease (RuvC/YqgF family)